MEGMCINLMYGYWDGEIGSGRNEVLVFLEKVVRWGNIGWEWVEVDESWGIGGIG